MGLQLSSEASSTAIPQLQGSILSMTFGCSCENYVETWTFVCARSARALIKAEAEVENEEKLGEAAMQFFYGNKVLIFGREEDLN